MTSSRLLGRNYRLATAFAGVSLVVSACGGVVDQANAPATEGPTIAATAAVTDTPAAAVASATAAITDTPAAVASATATNQPPATSTATAAVTDTPTAPVASATTAPEPASTDFTISAQNISFNPGSLTIPVGREVRITFINNDDSIPHSLHVTGPNGFDEKTEIFVGSDGRSRELVFTANDSGQYSFVCDVHPSMTGIVIVQ